MYTIENTIQVTATPSSVLAALTTHDGLVGWWTTDVDCDADKREATFRFARATGARAATFKLISADEHRVAMECIREINNSDWLGTTLSFKLTAANGGTRVDLEHAGYPAKNEVYDNCTTGWAYFMGSLKSYVETGTGTPFVSAAAVKAS